MIYTYIKIVCDDCGKTDEQENSTPPQATWEWQDKGWCVSPEQELCPDCHEKTKRLFSREGSV